MHPQQAAVIKPAKSGDPVHIWQLGPPDGHMLVPRLQRADPPQLKQFRRSAVLVKRAGPIVVYLVIVERYCKSTGRVGRLEVGIRLVKRVPAAVIIDAVDFAADVLANGPPA